LRAAFLQGYRQEFTLTVHDEHCLETFLALRILDYVNWIAGWSSPGDDPWGRAFLERSVTMVRAFLDGDPWLHY